MAHIDIRKTMRGSTPRIAFGDIATTVLGAEYELSLVLCGDALARRINTETRKKTYAPNVLSFPLDEGAGEIILNIRKAEREAREMGISTTQRIAHLYVHGLYHLKGLDHQTDKDAQKMERMEDKILSQFNLV